MKELKRFRKDSFYWYANVILENGQNCRSPVRDPSRSFRQLARFSLGQADMIRRAMSKKIRPSSRPSALHSCTATRAEYPRRAVARGVPGGRQTRFTTRSSPLQATPSTRRTPCPTPSCPTARRMKRNYPHEYMAALLTSVLDNTPKVTEYIAECHRAGHRLPPEHQCVDADFTVEEGDLRFGLVAIKGVGRGLIQSAHARAADRRAVHGV